MCFPFPFTFLKKHQCCTCVTRSTSVGFLVPFILNFCSSMCVLQLWNESFKSLGFLYYSACLPRKASSSKSMNVSAHFHSVILLHNVLSLRPEKPRLRHFATKWNKFSFDKPAGPSLAVKLSQSNEMSGGSVKPFSLSFSHLCSGVLSNIHFITRRFPNSFPAENEFTVNTGITENYKCSNQLLNDAV